MVDNTPPTPPSRREILKFAGSCTAAAVAVSAPVSSDDDGNGYETVPAEGERVELTEGETYENKLIDLSTGQDFIIEVMGGDVTIRNVGFSGLFQGKQFAIMITAPSGEVLLENIYMGDGSNKSGSTHRHGPGGVFYDKAAGCNVTVRHCNVQGWSNNGFYCSNTASGGTITFEECFGKNNGVSTFRCASPKDTITGCVAYNDDTDYSTENAAYGGYPETNGRPVWVWSPGGVTIEDSHFSSGSYDHSVVAHHGATVEYVSGEFDGEVFEEATGTVNVGDDVGDDPDLSIPDGVPESAEEAAQTGLDESGGGGGGLAEEKVPTPWEEKYDVEHVYLIENTGDDDLEYYLQVDGGRLGAIDFGPAVITPGKQWSEGDKAAGVIDPGNAHCWGLDGVVIDVSVSREEGVSLSYSDNPTSLDEYPHDEADGDDWKDIDELLD